MADTEKKSKDRLEAEQSPVVWLTVYEAAKRKNNRSMMERARKELENRGVLVKLAESVAPATEGSKR